VGGFGLVVAGEAPVHHDPTGWVGRDCETLPASSEAMIHIASIGNLAKRITDETAPTWRGTY
jgi:hypothetical protein